MRKRSRLTRRQNNRIKKNLFLSVLGIIAIIFLLLKFGVPALANFAIFLSGINESDKSDTKKEVSFIPSPVLDSGLAATNSASVIISGRTPKEGIIEIYINDELRDTVNTKEDGTFSTEQIVKVGENSIKARTDLDGKNSTFSNTLYITYIKSAPNLTIATPVDGQSYQKDENKAVVSGQTDSGVTVTVNGFWAVIDDMNSYSYELPLKDGDNEINIVALDQAGNKTEKNIKVTYSQ
ncbi:MAG: hypothetical protein V1697_02790 [Candidatus Levyibacteriota bacterium]